MTAEEVKNVERKTRIKSGAGTPTPRLADREAGRTSSAAVLEAAQDEREMERKAAAEEAELSLSLSWILILESR